MFFRLNLKKSILNLGMVTACVISMIILFRSYFMYGLTKPVNVDILTLTINPLAMSGFIPFACVFPILPFAFSYLEEKNSGYIKSILTRTTQKRYIITKVFFTGFSGGISMVIPFTILFIYTYLIGKPVSSDLFPQVYLDHMWGKYIFIWGGVFVLVCRIVLVFLFGCIWAEMALLVSTICPNRYVTFLAPFIIYQLAWMTFQNDILVKLNPAVLFRSDFVAGTPLYQPFLVQCIILLVISILIYRNIRCGIRANTV